MSRLYSGRCQKCGGKRVYRTSLDCLLDHQHNPRKIRAYKCPHGNGFHATSQPERRATT